RIDIIARESLFERDGKFFGTEKSRGDGFPTGIVLEQYIIQMWISERAGQCLVNVLDVGVRPSCSVQIKAPVGETGNSARALVSHVKLWLRREARREFAACLFVGCQPLKEAGMNFNNAIKRQK